MSSGFQDDQDRSDMQQLAGGHDAALSSLMDRHGERLFHFLLRGLQNETEAGDLAQETFVRIYQNRHRYDPGQKLSTWLFAIAANLVRDRYRWRTRHPEVSVHGSDDRAGADWFEHLPDPAPTPGENLDRAERAEAVRRAVAELPEDLRIPLILAEYEHLPHAEIAQIVGGSAKAVEMRIYRARKELRTRLGGLKPQR